jgi:hypothetical protein
METNRCLDKVKQGYAHMNSISPQPGKAYLAEYEMKAKYAEGEHIPDVEDKVKIISNGARSSWQGKEMEIYEDENHQVSILKRNKIIQVTKKPDKGMNQERLKGFMVIKDTLLTGSKVLFCQDVKFPGTDQLSQKITLSLKKEFQKGTGIESFTFWLDKDQPKFKRIKVQYLPGRNVKEYDIVILVSDPDFKGEPFIGNAIDKVLAKKGGLLPEFQGYHLLDMR